MWLGVPWRAACNFISPTDSHTYEPMKPATFRSWVRYSTTELYSQKLSNQLTPLLTEVIRFFFITDQDPYAWWANTPPHPPTNRVYLRLSSLNAASKWRLWCCSYQQSLLPRRKRTLVQTDAVPCTTEDHKLMKKNWIHVSVKTHHNEHRRRIRDKKISNGQRSLGQWHLLQLPRT